MRRVMEAEAFGVVVLLTPGDRFSVDIDADIGAGEAAPAEIVVPQPVRPPPAARPDVEDVRAGIGQPLRKHEHPEVARVHQEVHLVVQDTIADTDAHPQVVGRQVAELRVDQARHDVEGIDNRAKQWVKG